MKDFTLLAICGTSGHLSLCSLPGRFVSRQVYIMRQSFDVFLGYGGTVRPGIQSPVHYLMCMCLTLMQSTLSIGKHLQPPQDVTPKEATDENNHV